MITSMSMLCSVFVLLLIYSRLIVQGIVLREGRGGE